MTENTRVSLIYLGSAFLFTIILVIWYLDTRKKDGQNIKENIGYAIGTLDKCGTSYGPRLSSTSILISFESKSERINKTPINGKGRNCDKIVEGGLYLVIYDTLSPKTCHMLFDYPIKDSIDFRRYLEEFKTKPLDFDKYF